MPRPPNVLLLFTDMQRADTIGALGNPLIRTPALDRLCAEGTAFTKAYTPSPVCVPARYSMHYGRWASRSGLTGNGRMPEDDGTSWAARLAQAGYRTHAIGKLHFTPDPLAKRGFAGRETQEELVGQPNQDDYLRFLHQHGGSHISDPHGVRGEMYYIPQPAQMAAELHPTHWVGDRSLAFIKRQKRDQPWALMTSFIHPHPPFAVPSPWHKLYRGPDMPLPLIPNDSEAHRTWTNRIQNRYKYRDQGFDLQLLRQIKAYYYACISFVDAQIGRIVTALAERGELDNTLILFSSDHGEYLGDYGNFGKRCMHDASARIPLLARLPGAFAGGRTCARPASLVDILPTVCALTGANADDSDGVRLDQLARGRSRRNAVFSQHGAGDEADYAIFTGDHTYWYCAGDDRELVFDNLRDPHQQQLLAPQPLHPEIGTLRQRLISHLKDMERHEALDGDDWRHFPPRRQWTHAGEGLLVQDHSWADQRIPGYTS